MGIMAYSLSGFISSTVCRAASWYRNQTCLGATVRAVAKVFRTALQAKREIPRITTTFCVIQEVDCLAEYYATFFYVILDNLI